MTFQQIEFVRIFISLAGKLLRIVLLFIDLTRLLKELSPYCSYTMKIGTGLNQLDLWCAEIEKMPYFIAFSLPCLESMNGPRLFQSTRSRSMYLEAFLFTVFSSSHQVDFESHCKDASQRGF